MVRLEELEALHLAAAGGGLTAGGRGVRQLLLHLLGILLVGLLDLLLLLRHLLGVHAVVELLVHADGHLERLAVGGGSCGLRRRRRRRRLAVLLRLVRLLVVVVVHPGPLRLLGCDRRPPLRGVGAIAPTIGAWLRDLVLRLKEPQVLLAAGGGGGLRAAGGRRRRRVAVGRRRRWLSSNLRGRRLRGRRLRLLLLSHLGGVLLGGQAVVEVLEHGLGHGLAAAGRRRRVTGRLLLHRLRVRLPLGGVQADLAHGRVHLVRALEILEALLGALGRGGLAGAAAAAAGLGADQRLHHSQLGGRQAVLELLDGLNRGGCTLAARLAVHRVRHRGEGSLAQSKVVGGGGSLAADRAVVAGCHGGRRAGLEITWGDHQERAACTTSLQGAAKRHAAVRQTRRAHVVTRCACTARAALAVCGASGALEP